MCNTTKYCWGKFSPTAERLLSDSRERIEECDRPRWRKFSLTRRESIASTSDHGVVLLAIINSGSVFVLSIFRIALGSDLGKQQILGLSVDWGNFS